MLFRPTFGSLVTADGDVDGFGGQLFVVVQATLGVDTLDLGLRLTALVLHQSSIDGDDRGPKVVVVVHRERAFRCGLRGDLEYDLASLAVLQ